MPTLSVILITLNEAHGIRHCLDAIRFADEIIVVDSGSTDNTVSICREYTEHVYQMDWPGYSKQKNRALEKATGDWVLSLDADEIVTPELADAIKHTIANADHAAFKIRFHPKFMGQQIHFGDWRNEYHTRLFKRSQGKFGKAALHEDLQIEGTVGKLKQAVIHDSYKDYDELISKINRYSTCGAEERKRQGKKGSFAKALFKSWWAFLRSYIFKLGFLDGQAGYIIAKSISEYTFYRYLKLSRL